MSNIEEVAAGVEALFTDNVDQVTAHLGAAAQELNNVAEQYAGLIAGGAESGQAADVLARLQIIQSTLADLMSGVVSVQAEGQAVANTMRQGGPASTANAISFSIDPGAAIGDGSQVNEGPAADHNKEEQPSDMKGKVLQLLSLGDASAVARLADDVVSYRRAGDNESVVACVIATSILSDASEVARQRHENIIKDDLIRAIARSAVSARRASFTNEHEVPDLQTVVLATDVVARNDTSIYPTQPPAKRRLFERKPSDPNTDAVLIEGRIRRAAELKEGLRAYLERWTGEPIEDDAMLIFLAECNIMQRLKGVSPEAESILRDRINSAWVKLPPDQRSYGRRPNRVYDQTIHTR